MGIRTLLVAFLFAGGLALAWLNFKGDPPPMPATVLPPVKILAAKEPLQAGTLLKDVDLRERDVPADQVEEGTFVATDDNRAEVRGAMLRRYLDAGDVIRRPDILRPRDRGFLAAVLASGTRAVSIGVDAKTGAAGLISPGDLVDVILAQEFAHGETQLGKRVVAETVLSSVRVIAVDQQIAQGAPTAAAGVAALSNSNGNRIASTVSLQVTPEQAAKLVVAERLGRLTLVVRSMEGDTPSKGADVPSSNVDESKSKPAQTSVFGSDVSAALSQDEAPASPRMRLIQGDAVNEVIFR